METPFSHCKSMGNFLELKAANSVVSGRIWPKFEIRVTENRFFASPDRFLICKTDSVCIKHIFFGPKKHTLRITYWPNYLH